MKSKSEILIKLRRQYKDHEVISALYKRLSEKDVCIGKLNSYIQELEYNILEINKNMQEQRDELLEILQSLVLSMSAHPDCIKGSEFDDLSSIAQELINKIKDNE